MAYTQSQIQDELHSYLSKRFLAKGVQLDAALPFADFGIDSMTVVELVMHIEEKFSIEIPADQLTGDNLKSLESLVNCAMANQAK
ncbi:MAG: acyl carrier protein [Flavobacteriales bacterium]|nr:acyl carrier protein [Flavobacteriales bacterium]